MVISHVFVCGGVGGLGWFPRDLSIREAYSTHNYSSYRAYFN